MNSKPNNDIKIPYIPVSWGELFDKICILEIKKEKASSKRARQNIFNEFDLLHENLIEEILNNREVKALRLRLKVINQKLWDIEDEMRNKEVAGDFNERFIKLARNTYKYNDERAAIKRQINNILNSTIYEEKIY